MKRVRIAGLAFWLVTISILLASNPANGVEVTFHLVPQESWRSDQLAKDAFLPEGTVRLFRGGTYTVGAQVPLNEPVSVPAGDWVWIAEALGYVSISSGLLRLKADNEPKRIVWSAVPACDLMLELEEWKKVSRLDVVSLDYGATYPVIPKERQHFQVPAGRFIAYTVKGNTLIAITPIMACKASEQVALRPPLPPTVDRQALMIHALLPENVDAKSESTTVAMETPSGPFQEADARIFTSSRATAFFLSAPADPLHLAVSHPNLVSHREEVEPAGGSAREVTVILKPRPTLEIPVDYLPQRPHKEALLGLFRCDDIPRHYLEISSASCEAAAEPRSLLEGLKTYSFSNLDVGQYLAMAWIDGEELPGLEDRLAPFLEAEPSKTIAPLQTLEEFHIFGHLLVENRSVPGDVRLEPMDEPEQAKVFPTDSDLLYHIYYFGQVRSEYDLKWLPPEERQLRSSFRGVPEFHMLRACDEENRCRSFHHRSTWNGSGRFDIQLDTGAHLKVTVVDADQEKPIPRAFVLIGRRSEPAITTHFLAGELFSSGKDHDQGASGEGLGLYANDAGEVDYLALDPGDFRMNVKADGYQIWTGNLVLLDGEWVQQEVVLEPIRSMGGLRVRFSDGRPAKGAFLLTFQPDGRPDYRCSQGVNVIGEVNIAEGCLANQHRSWVALHSDAILQELTPAELQQAGEIELQRRSSTPLRLRLRDNADQPLREAKVSLRFPRFTLTPNHLLLAGRTGHRFPFRTDALGELVLPFLDPGGVLPEVGVGEGGSYPLVAGGGGVIDLIVP